MSGTGEPYDVDPEDYEPESDVPDVRFDEPEADALEQQQPADPEARDDVVTTIPADVPEADALEQARSAGLDEDDDEPA
jgi:hypothetical protein